MLTLSKSQYKDLCHDCAGQMMQGSGEGLPDTIPDFTGTNIQFYVSDPHNIATFKLPYPGTKGCPRAYTGMP